MKVLHKAELGNKEKLIEKRYKKLDQSMNKKKKEDDEDLYKKQQKELEKRGMITEVKK